MTLLQFTLIPEENHLLDDDTASVYADRTYSMDLKNGYIKGNIEGEEALKQCVFKILATEKDAYPIYSSSYGVALDDLKYLAAPVIESELKRRISEALFNDERIEEVRNFSFAKHKERLNVEFTVCRGETAVSMAWNVEGL